MRLVTAALWAALTALGCAGAPPAVTPKSEPGPRISLESPGPEPDLRPVARPDNVVAIGRVSRPGQVLGQLAQWQDGSSWSDLIEELARGLGDLALAEAPLDVVVSIERSPAGPLPDLSAVISVGLESRERVEEELDGSGMIRRELAPGVKLLAGSGRRRCAVAAAAGPAPVRLVCGSSRAALEELLPYATRGLSREPAPPEDVRFELDVARARALHGERIAALERFALPFARVALGQLDFRLERAIGPLGSALFGELLQLLGDVDRVEATARLEHSHLNADVRASFGRDPESYFTQALLELASRQAEPPDAFWMLPLDAHFAFHSHGMSPARAATLRRTLSGALSRATRAPIPRATIDLVVEALFPEPSFVYAFGLLDPPPSYDASDAEHIRWQAQRMLGWHVIGIETDPKQLERRLDRGMRDYNAGPLRNLAYAELPMLCPGLPKITRRPAPRKGLPAGSVVYEMLVPGKLFTDCARRWSFQPPSTPAPLGLAVVYAPGKPRSWIVVAPDTDFAIAKLRALLDGESSARLESLRAELTSPALFGAVSSVGLLDAVRKADRPTRQRLGAPRERMAWWLSVDGPRALRVRGRLPGAAFR
jgi:hypothetical protein